MSAGRKIAGGSGGSGGGGGGSGVSISTSLDTTNKQMNALNGSAIVTDWIDIRSFTKIGLILKWTILSGPSTDGTGLLSYHSVLAVTTAALPTCISSGTGTGHLLTKSTNGAFPTIDGVTIGLGDPILVKNQVAQKDNGIYTLVDAGSAGTPWQLQRAVDFAAGTPTSISYGAYVKNQGGGTVNASRPFVVTTADPIVVDTDAIAFAPGDPYGQFYIDVANTNDSGALDTPLDITIDSPNGDVWVPSALNAYEKEAVDLTLPWAFFRVRYVPDTTVPTNGSMTITGFAKD